MEGKNILHILRQADLRLGQELVLEDRVKERFCQRYGEQIFLPVDDSYHYRYTC